MTERLIEIGARGLGMDRAEIRRRNLVRPDEFPHDNRLGLVYDCGIGVATYIDLSTGTPFERSDGRRLGTVRGLENFGAGDLIEIASDDGRVLTLPFDRQTVPVVDLAHGRLVVEPPPELIPGEGNVEPRP